jgi:galactokinase
MMGGGFGGCTINLIHQDSIDELFTKLSMAYQQEMNLELKMYSVVTADGTSKVETE